MTLKPEHQDFINNMNAMLADIKKGIEFGSREAEIQARCDKEHRAYVGIDKNIFEAFSYCGVFINSGDYEAQFQQAKDIGDEIASILVDALIDQPYGVIIGFCQFLITWVDRHYRELIPEKYALSLNVIKDLKKLSNILDDIE